MIIVESNGSLLYPEYQFNEAHANANIMQLMIGSYL